MFKKTFVVPAAIFTISAFAAVLPSGSGIWQGQTITSDTNKYRLVMQGDGNFVHYRNSDNAIRFATMAFGYYAVMQTDGNLVEYGLSGAAI
jgi:hypothetical protein